MTSDVPFTNQEIDIMADALMDVCAVLKIPEGWSYERDVIAAHIIELAETGVLDAAVLRDQVLLVSGSLSPVSK